MVTPICAAKSSDELPRIYGHHRDLDSMVRQAWSAIVARPPSATSLYRRSGGLAIMWPSDAGPPTIASPRLGWIRRYLASCASWVRATQQGDLPMVPPDAVVHAVADSPPPLRLPPLDRVISAPVIDSDGNLCSTPGYLPSVRAWLIGGLDVSVPERPSDRDVVGAVDKLRYATVDFPWAYPGDFSRWVGYAALPFARALIDGPTPLHLVSAPKQRSGKSRLVDLALIAWRGTIATPIVLRAGERDAEHAEKLITSILMRGESHVCLDNATQRNLIDSAELAAALSSGRWGARVLGASRFIELEQSAAWSLTANNPRMSGELCSRAIEIRLSPSVERPELRTGFAEPHLLQWARAHRADLVSALLTIIRRWICAGRPRSAWPCLGGFESWSEVISGIVDCAGLPGWGDGRERLEARSSGDDDLIALVGEWSSVHGSTKVSSEILRRLAVDNQLLAGVMGDRGELAQAQRLGRALQSASEGIYGGWRICSGRVDGRMMYWLGEA